MIYTAGKRLRASDLADLTAAAAAWTTYTPVWSAASTAVSLGNGTCVGTYRKVGQTVDVRVTLTMGSTTTFGTSFYRLSLPYAPKLDSIIPVYCDDNSGSVRWAGHARIIAATTGGDNMRMVVTAGGAGVTNTSPFTWAQSDVLVMSGQYEIN
jgi:hypothetical protein